MSFNSNFTSAPIDNLSAPIGSNLLSSNLRTKIPTTGSIAYDAITNEIYYGTTSQWNTLKGITGPTGMGGSGSGVVAGNIFFVAKNGNDTTGDGSISNPFLTIQRGIDVAYTTDVNPLNITNRPCVYVMPGTYTENPVLKANVLVKGFGFNNTRVSGNWTIDNTFTPAGDFRSGLADIGIFGNFTADFLSVTSPEGKIFSWNVRFGGNVTVIASNTIINQFIQFGGEIFGVYSQTGANGQFYNVIMQGGTIILNEQTGQSPIFFQYGGIRCSMVVNSLILPFFVELEGEVKAGSSLTLNGTMSSIIASAIGLPVTSLIGYVGGATSAQITRVNDVFGEAYTPSVPSDWKLPVPQTAQQALDQIASRLTLGGL